jgi:hypothetical protein
MPRWSASGQRFRKRCQSQRDRESAILFEIPEICKALIIILYCKVDNAWASNKTLELFTDSAGGQNRGFGIYFQGKWAQKCYKGHNSNRF